MCWYAAALYPLQWRTLICRSVLEILLAWTHYNSEICVFSDATASSFQKFFIPRLSTNYRFPHRDSFSSPPFYQNLNITSAAPSNIPTESSRSPWFFSCYCSFLISTSILSYFPLLLSSPKVFSLLMIPKLSYYLILYLFPFFSAANVLYSSFGFRGWNSHF